MEKLDQRPVGPTATTTEETILKCRKGMLFCLVLKAKLCMLSGMVVQIQLVQWVNRTLLLPNG
jgi:hypothetical protein